jgi:integrase
MSFPQSVLNAPPWNKDKLIGQKPPLKLEQVWAIRIRLEMANKLRDLVLFNLAIDSKLRGCDLVKLQVRDVYRGSESLARTQVIQQKTKRPVQFEITKKTRKSIEEWVQKTKLKSLDYLFPCRFKAYPHISTKQYHSLVHQWIEIIGLDSSAYGTHSLRRTKVALLYKQTKNLRAVQILLGHTNLESTVRYLGVEVEDALELSENMEI